MQKTLNKKILNGGGGFTLIELLVVIAVIGMLASIVLVSLKGTREKTSIAKGKNLSSQIAHVLGIEARGIWHFEETSGPSLDSSGYGGNGTWNNVQSKTVAECGLDLGGCLYFNGNANVDVGSSSAQGLQNTVTVSAWVYYSGDPSWRTYFGRKSWATQQFFNLAYNINCGPTVPWMVYYGNFQSFCWGDDLRNQWVHLVVTYDSSLSSANFKTYQNGVAKQTRNFNGIAILDGSASLIGNSVDVRPWNGYIDEVAIYAATFTAGEIQQLYAEGAPRHQVASVPGM
ncbi:MAG: LamG-like jellyroll fold domain-containing protein [bacterium]|nr:LamG-like jellyroll fold domain-containing protein [bacterium]